MLKKDYTKRVVNLVLVLFSIFTVISLVYFFVVSRMRINAVKIAMDILRGAIDARALDNLALRIDGFYWLFFAEWALFAVASISLISGLWFVTHLYLVYKRRALIDALTEVYNKRAILFGLQKEIGRAVRYKHPLSVAVLDIDFFKIYNDTHGHIAGDKLLKRFAHILTNQVREYDYVGRFGGEEFMILFPETKLKDAAKICERVRKAVSAFKFEGENLLPYKDVTVSIGVSEFSGDRAIKDEVIIEKADKSLYKAKESGRNAVVFD